MPSFSLARPVTQDTNEGTGLKLSMLIVVLQADTVVLGLFGRRKQVGEYTAPGGVQLEKHYFVRKELEEGCCSEGTQVYVLVVTLSFWR